MQLFALITLISSIFVLSVGIFVYSRDRKSPLSRVFLFLCILAFYFSFIESMLHDADSISSAYLWLKLTALWTFLPAAFFHFTLVFTKSGLIRRSRWIPVLIYVPAALFSIIELTTDLIITTPVLKYWGYTYGYSSDPLPFLVELAWVFGLFVMSLLLFSRYYFRTTGVQEKNQIKYIMTGFSVVVIVTFVSEILFPLFSINLPTTETISIVFFFALIGYAIWKYELFVVSPAMAADNIVSTMTDSLILLDTSHTIISVNDATQKILRYEKEELIGLPFSAIFSDPAGTEAILSGITVSGPVTDLETAYRSKEGITIPVSFSGSVIRDAQGNCIGIVCISRDITERKRTEETLRESEEKFRILAESCPFAIAIYQDDSWVYTNPAGERISGYTADELYAMHYWDFVAPEFQSFVKEAGRNRQTLESVIRFYDFRIITKDKKEKWVSLSGTPIIFRGKAAGLITIINITEWKRAEEALRESEEKLRTLFNNANDMITLHGFDASGMPGTYIEVNDVACRRLKYSREELLSKSPKDIVAPECLNRMAQNTRSLCATGNATFEMIHLTKDQQRVPVEISAHLFDFRGKPHVLSMVRDITERKQAEDAVRVSENRYRTILENTGIAINLIEENTRISVTNAEFARMSGFSKEEIEGKKSWTDFIVKEDLERMLAQHRLRLGNKDAALEHYEFGFITKTGEIRTIFLTIEKIPGTKQWVASLMDITERKRAEEQLRFLLREKEILLREIHHRVRNTIQLAISMMKIQMRRENDERVQIALLDTQNRLNAIAATFDMLYYSGDMSRVNLKKIIGSIVGSIRSAHKTGECTLQSDIRIDISELGIDLALPLALITSELVTNAFGHAFPDGRSGMVTVTGSEDEHGQITLAVNDNGSGLPEGFSPAESGTTGFTLVRTLVQQIDGLLSYETSGKGTRFIITVSRDAEFKKSGVNEV